MLKRIGKYTGFLQGQISAVSTIIPVDTLFLDIIAAAVNLSLGDYFYMSIQEDEYIEEVKVIGAGATWLVVDRHEGGTIARDFSLAARYDTSLTGAEVEERAAGLAPVTTVNIAGTGLADVTDLGGGNFNVDVPVVSFSTQNGVEITGTYPNYTVGLANNGNCCGDEDAGVGTGTINLIGAGLAAVSEVDGNYTINVPAPNFAGSGVAITGTWPNLTFTATAGETGTVEGVAVEAGLYLTGAPNVSPTIGISNTGVAAGDYGDITFNSRGQATEIAATFNPISAIAAGDGILVSRAGGEVTVSVVAASEGVPGVVALADADDPLDENDVTTAVTPALLAAVVGDLVSGSAQGGQTYSGEADASYVNTVATAVVVLDLEAGESAIVQAQVTMFDPAAASTPQEFGMAIFAATGARIHANRMFAQSQQSMQAIITGPFSDGIVIKTTAIPVGASVVSHSIVAMEL